MQTNNGKEHQRTSISSSVLTHKFVGGSLNNKTAINFNHFIAFQFRASQASGKFTGEVIYNKKRHGEMRIPTTLV